MALSAIEDVVQRKLIQNTSFIKQAIIKSSKKIKNLSITEQGAGVFDLEGFFQLITKSTSKNLRAMIYPFKVDFRSNSTYFLPFSR